MVCGLRCYSHEAKDVLFSQCGNGASDQGMHKDGSRIFYAPVRVRRQTLCVVTWMTCMSRADDRR